MQQAAVIVEPVELNPPVEAVVVSFARAERPAILESSLPHPAHGRYSIFACEPADEFTHAVDTAGCPFRRLARHVDAYPKVPGHRRLPFVGGWIGYIGYEAGIGIEGLVPTTREGNTIPEVLLRLYDTAVLCEHRPTGDNTWYIVAVDWPESVALQRPPVAQRVANMRARLQAAAAEPPAHAARPATTVPAVPNMSRRAYLAAFDRAMRYIAAGEIYQVNLSQRFAITTDAPPELIYRRLRRTSPSSHAALLVHDGFSVISASPELFLRLREGAAITRPIKGTRPRTGDAAIDAVHRHELASSEKERAELNMIIDLLRNDLGRVCRFGSVRVLEDGIIEEHPTVLHRVATIEGHLRHPARWLDLLLATFPGGSITGAPKIRAMQIIDELEPTVRGPYCGAIGTLGLDGSMELNVAIRTMLQREGTVYAYAGGAIVADSVGAREYEEILTKASGMLEALGAEAHGRRKRDRKMTLS